MISFLLRCAAPAVLGLGVLAAGCASHGTVELRYDPASDAQIERSSDLEAVTVHFRSFIDSTNSADLGRSRIHPGGALSERVHYWPKPPEFAGWMKEVFRKALEKRGWKVEEGSSPGSREALVLTVRLLKLWAESVKAEVPATSWTGCDVEFEVELTDTAGQRAIFRRKYSEKAHLRHEDVKERGSTGEYATDELNHALALAVRRFVMDASIQYAVFGLPDGMGGDIPFNTLLMVRRVHLIPAHDLVTGEQRFADMILSTCLERNPRIGYDLLIERGSMDECVQIARNIASRPFIVIQKPETDALVTRGRAFDRDCIVIRDTRYVTLREIGTGVLLSRPEYVLYGLEGEGTLRSYLESQGLKVWSTQRSSLSTPPTSPPSGETQPSGGPGAP